MTKRLELSQDWLRSVLPEGLPYPSSTLISGPGGSGKPLVGFGFVYDWLKLGGSVIFVPLQYPKTNFVEDSLERLYHLETADYAQQLAYIQFDLDVARWEKREDRLHANLLKPGVWQEAIDELEQSLIQEGPGTLVFASALNLLLFSPTYQQSSLLQIEEMIAAEEERSYLFSVSTSAMREKVRNWEEAADNLLVTHMKGDLELYLELKRLENEEKDKKEVKVPLAKERLKEIKQVAESVRTKRIPRLRQI